MQFSTTRRIMDARALLALVMLVHHTMSSHIHNRHHVNVKKSFLTDAMNEMEYGSAHAPTKLPQDGNKTKDHQNNETSKPVTNQAATITRISPTHLIRVVEDEAAKGKNVSKVSANSTPVLKAQTLRKHESSQRENKNSQHLQNTEAKTPKVEISSINPTPSSTTLSKESSSLIENKMTDSGNSTNSKQDITTAITLLREFVKKLLKKNKTNQTTQAIEEGTNVTLSEKKDVLKESDESHPSTIISGIKYKLAPVYQLRPKQNGSASINVLEKEDTLKRLKEEEDVLKHSLQEKQQQIENLRQNVLVNDSLRTKVANHSLEIASKDQTQPSNVGTNYNTNHSLVEITTNNFSAESKNQTRILNDSGNNTADAPSSNKTLETDTKIQTAQTLNEDAKNDIKSKFSALKGVPPELLDKLKELLNARKHKNKKSMQQEASRKAFETARKLVKAAFAREQLYKAEEDFFEKVKEMMNKTSTENVINNSRNTHAVDDSDENVNNDLSTVKDYIKVLEDEQKNVASAVRRNKPSPRVNSDSNYPNVTSPKPGDGAKPSNLPSSNSNSSVSHAARGPPGLPLNTAVSGANILKSLNHSKGPDDKSVEEAAHLEEKVAEQQDEMYENLVRQTLNKGLAGREEDDDEEDEVDEEAAARDLDNRSSDDTRPAENYGDFQDSDEGAHTRSEVMDNNESSDTLPTIDENAVFSLKRDGISRPKPGDSTKKQTKRCWYL